MKSLSLRLWVGFIAALSLSILPLPTFISSFRPPWVLLLVLYIEYYLPHRMKLSALFLVGIALDVLLFKTIGQYSFALLTVAGLAANKSRRFRFFPMTQQILLIGFFCLLYQTILSLIDVLLGFNYSLVYPLGSTAFAMLLWPWIRLLGDDTLGLYTQR